MQCLTARRCANFAFSRRHLVRSFKRVWSRFRLLLLLPLSLSLSWSWSCQFMPAKQRITMATASTRQDCFQWAYKYYVAATKQLHQGSCLTSCNRERESCWRVSLSQVNGLKLISSSISKIARQRPFWVEHAICARFVKQLSMLLLSLPLVAFTSILMIVSWWPEW